MELKIFFPIIHKTIIHPKITKALEKSNFYHHSFSNMYDKNWTNITYPYLIFFRNIFLLSCLEIILLILLYLLKSQLYFCLLLFDMCNNLLNLLLLFQNFYLLNLNLFCIYQTNYKLCFFIFISFFVYFIFFFINFTHFNHRSPFTALYTANFVLFKNLDFYATICYN